MEIVYRINKKLKKLILISFAMFIALQSIVTIKLSTPIYAKSNKKVIRFMVNEPNIGLERCVNGFEKKHPNIDIKFLYVDNYCEKALNKLKSNNSPDVMFIPPKITDSDKQKYLLKLGNRTQLEKEYNYLDQAIKIDEDIYGLPSRMFLAGFVYNKKVFEKAGITKLPTSMDEFLKDMSYIKNNTDKIPFYSGYTYKWALTTWEYFTYIEMMGDEKNNEIQNGSNPFATGSTHEKVYDFYCNILRNHYCEDSCKDYTWENAVEDLANGNLGCIAAGSWAIQIIQKASDNPSDIGYMPFPNTIRNKQFASVIADLSVGISKKTKYPEEAKEFVDYFLDESNYNLETQNISIVKGRLLPEVYREVKNLCVLQNCNVSENMYQHYIEIGKHLNMFSGNEQKRIADATLGYSNEKVENIYREWSRRWIKSQASVEKNAVGDNIQSINAENVNQDLTNFTEQEKKYIKTLPILKVGILTDAPPFSYMGKKNKIRGMSKLVADDIMKKMKTKYKFVFFDNEAQMTKALDNRTIDLALGVEDTASNIEKYKLTKSYMEYNNVLVRNKKLRNVSRLNLADCRAAVVKNMHRDYYKGIKKKHKCDSVEDAIESVNDGDADYTILNYYTANYYIRNGQYSNLEIISTSSKNSLKIAFRDEENAQMLSIFNKCLYDISDSSLETYLLNEDNNLASKMDIKMLMRQYPMHFVLGILFIYLLVLVEIWFSGYEKQKYLHKQEFYAKRYALLAEMMDEYIFEYNLSENTITVDEKFREFFEFSKNCIDVNQYEKNNEKLNQFIEALKNMVKYEKKEQRIYFGNLGDQNVTWVRIFISQIEDEDTNNILYVGKISNVQHEMEERQMFLKQTALDSLTKVYNRSGFNKIYNDQYSSNCKYERAVVGILDYDNFKKVNDTLGHLGGDKALKVLAEELRKTFKDIGIFARYGGDEFIFYIPDGRDVEKIRELLANLVKRMNKILKYENNFIRISISIGAVIVSSKKNIDDAFDLADHELYKIKENNKNAYRLKNYCKV
ncbi:extracellular solute-binding protein [Lachnobacterium bovis]|uniref:extracellular solute-binding protein n=1 Tax=Lachnobacterium bovis TaxID=140626 RepID=UPI00048D1994|nr:extracellular solute-binding protein [Lachnobacterium bovis]